MDAATSRRQAPRQGSLARTARRVTVTAVLTLGLAAPLSNHALPVQAQASTVTFSTAEVAPADAVAYVVTTLDDRTAQWQLADTLLDRAGVGEALDEAVAKELQDESGEDLPLDAFLGGEVAVVVTQTALDTLAEESMGGADLEEMLGSLGVATPEAVAATPEAQGFAFALDTRAPDTAWAGIRESVKDQPTEQQDYEGTSILYAPPASDEDEGMAAARSGDLILIATAPADLYPLIDTADGRTPNVTTLPEFTTARDALPGEFLTFGYVNAVAMPDSDLGPFAPLADELATQSVSAMTIAADEPGFRMETVAFPPAGEAFPPSAANYESELVHTAPDNAVFFASGADLGATKVLDVIGATVLGFAFGMGDMGMMSPDATPAAGGDPEAMIAKQFEDAAALIGVNLQTELLHQLVGEYGAWLTADMASEHVSGLLASKTERPDTVTNALMQVSYLIQGASGSESMLSTREVAGGQIYVLDLGDEIGSTLEFGVVGDQFVLGSGDAVDRLGGDAGPSLADNAQFTAVMDTLPVEHNGLVYIDMTQAIPLMETASEESEGLNFDEAAGIADASEACANYATQEEAQAAYDAAEPDTFDLDQDFDGQVCEDFFAAPAAAEAPADSSDDGDNPLANVDYSGIKAYAAVAYEEEGLQRSSSILYIAE